MSDPNKNNNTSITDAFKAILAKIVKPSPEQESKNNLNDQLNNEVEQYDRAGNPIPKKK